MRKTLLSLAMLIMTAMTAMAQYTVKIESAPESNWFSGYQAFDPTEIATALGYADTTAFYEALASENLVYVKDAEGNLTNAYTGNHNEFWMGTNATPQGFGDEGSCFYVGLSVDKESDPQEVDVAIGQMPDFFKYDPFEANFTLYLINGDKQVTFDITFTLLPLEKPNMQAPALKFSELEVVKEYEATVEFVQGKQYEGKTATVTLEGIYEALGVEAKDLDAAIKDVTLTRTYKGITADGETNYELSDSLVVINNAGTDGWFGRYSTYDESTGEETKFALNSTALYGQSSTIYTQQISLSEGTLSFVTGQFPAALSTDGTDYIEYYIVNGTKAAKVTLKIALVEPQGIPFEEMTKAGEETVEITAEVNNDYLTKPFSVDMANILATIGVESIDDFYTWASEGTLVNDHNEGSGGYYYNADGYIQAWGSDAAFFIGVASLADGSFTIGQMSNGTLSKVTEPTTASTELLFLGIDKYYVVKVNYTVKPVEEKGDDFTYNKVGDEGIIMQIVPSADTYEWGTKTALDMDYIESQIGTRDFTVMTDKAVDVTDEEGNVTGKELKYFDASYSCDPKPGFWYGDQTYENKEGQVIVENAGWGNNSFGVTYANGELTWFQFPGQRQIGDSFYAHLYLVNEETGNYLDYLLNVVYVEEVGAIAETVGTAEISHNVTAAEKEAGTIAIDLETADLYEKLGLSDELLEAASVIAPKSSTMFYTTSIGETLGFKHDGYFVDPADEASLDKLAITGYVTTENGKLQIIFDPMEIDFTAGSGTAIPAQVGFEYDGKRYIYTINITAPGETIGAEDNSAGWWTAFSKFYTINKGEVAHVTFKNYSSKGENWNNWLFIAQKAGVEINGAGEDEYLALRADNYGWAGKYNASSLKNDYDWGAFKEDMDGSDVDIKLYLNDSQNIVSEAVITTKDGKVYNYSHESLSIEADAFTFFFTVEKAHLEDFKVNIASSDEISTGIQSAPTATAVPAGIYSISGAKINALQKGINIIKMTDGTVKKVLVK